MSFCISRSVRRSVGRVIALAIVASVPMTLAAQSGAAASAKGPVDDPSSKWDIFIGYSYLAPSARIREAKNGTLGSSYGQINWGGITSMTRYFTRNLGVQIEGDAHIESEDWPVGDNESSTNTNDNFAGGAGGLIYRLPTYRFTPFIHALGGMEQVGSVYQVDKWGMLGTGGLGLDYSTSLLHSHLRFRVFQADYQYVKADNTAINSFRLSTGLVLHFGSIAPTQPEGMTCSPSAVSVYAGDPITVTAATHDVYPTAHTVFAWSGTGVTGHGDTATVDTTALAPATYTVKGEVKAGKPGKEGRRAEERASCEAIFTVKPFEPPTVQCSANPGVIKPGDTSGITATGVSPQNRPLTYSFQTASGSLNASGHMAIFTPPAGATGDYAISCNVADDKGQTATANTNVSIVAPVVVQAPHTQALCSIAFELDPKRPTRVDNEAKACLDQIALSLQKQSDAKAVLVGESTIAEQTAQPAKKHGKVLPVEDLAAQRAVNAKEYLVIDKGIDASRILVAKGTTNGKKVEDYLVPAEANFGADVQGTTPVDETAVKPQERKPLPEKKSNK